MHKSGGRQPAVGVGNTIAQTQARLFCRLPTVYVRIAVAFTVIVTTGGLRPPVQGIRLLLPLRCIHGNGYHGGLTPPALVLRCGRPLA
jgi:hypothetical protein